jgi:hypothetical protein
MAQLLRGDPSPQLRSAELAPTTRGAVCGKRVFRIGAGARLAGTRERKVRASIVCGLTNELTGTRD